MSNYKNGHWYTDKNGQHYFVENGQTPQEGWEASKRRKMISGGKYQVSEDGNEYKDVSEDEYNKFEADEGDFDLTNDDDFGFDEDDDFTETLTDNDINQIKKYADKYEVPFDGLKQVIEEETQKRINEGASVTNAKNEAMEDVLDSVVAADDKENFLKDMIKSQKGEVIGGDDDNEGMLKDKTPLSKEESKNLDSNNSGLSNFLPEHLNDLKLYSNQHGVDYKIATDLAIEEIKNGKSPDEAIENIKTKIIKNQSGPHENKLNNLESNDNEYNHLSNMLKEYDIEVKPTPTHQSKYQIKSNKLPFAKREEISKKLESLGYEVQGDGYGNLNIWNSLDENQYNNKRNDWIIDDFLGQYGYDENLSPEERAVIAKILRLK